MALPDAGTRLRTVAGSGKRAFQHIAQDMHHLLRRLGYREGCRVNLIVWLFGAHGVVRVAPYDEPAQLQPHQRWSAAASEQAAAAMAAPSWAAAKSTWADAPAREEDPEGEDQDVVDQAAHDEL